VVVVTFVVALMAIRGGAPAVLDEQEHAAVVVSPISGATAAIVAVDQQADPALAPIAPLETTPTAISVAEAPTLASVAALTVASPPALGLLGEATDQVVRAPDSGPLLPTYRIVTFYGHPHDPAMGIVGEYEKEELTELLRAEAANYAAADPSRPVIPAFELIATVAQNQPFDDGTYILDTDHETLRHYIDYAAELGWLVVLDLQIGRGSVANDFEKVRDLLALPNVHLALDPEFAVAEGEIPGEYIGSLTAESITWAQQELAAISAAHGIPPKILIVHQFREDMIQGKEQLAPIPGVQLVIDADGFGGPELKTVIYNVLVRDEPVEFAGIKLFYRQDVPVMTPREILDLVPSPDVVIYQ
jgi:hypothetical protein